MITQSTRARAHGYRAGQTLRWTFNGSHVTFVEAVDGTHALIVSPEDWKAGRRLLCGMLPLSELEPL
jgi:hypothetical protein